MYRLTLVHGLKRSGNHAIINWMRAQRRFVFRNNVVPVDPILAGQEDLPAPRPYEEWLRAYEAARRGRIRGQLRYAVLRRARLVASLEDLDPHYAPFTARNETVGKVVIVRDPKNLFASRLRKARRTSLHAYPGSDGPVLRRTRDLWKAHARHFLASAPDDPATVGVYYDRWTTDPSYRRAVCSRLRLPARSLETGGQARDGGGSSFAETGNSAPNDPAATRQRADLLDDDERALLAKIMADSELRDLAEQVAEAAHAVKAT